MRPLTGYFFEDYRVGQTFVHATPRTITAGDVALYIALTGARHAPHCAVTVAGALGHTSAPIDDLLVFHIAFGKTVPDISWNAVANLGYAETRFVAPVYAGDTLRCESEVIGLKQNSNGKSGVVYVRSSAFNQHDAMVLTWVRWVMVLKKSADITAVPDTVLPMLHKSAATESISVPAFLQPDGLTSAVTGSTRFWDDYRINEVINHPAGMTLDESDHTLATKLYQNTARVHFDLHHMKDSRFGRRLVYGGHIISICRALSYDGLENVISIAAINGGSHTNPSFAGDTLYAKSVIVEKIPLRPDLGAMRVRLLGIKNAAPAEIDATNPQLPETVVLDLDYTVLVPRIVNTSLEHS
ncbi:MAG: MaoC family dehydratase [Betaproteobacteria bacterium]|nr:MaoC family dehydratase [Betaproteobacteria bacterium]